MAAAGLSAVLALTPVAAPVGLAIADEGNGTAQSQAEQAITVTLVYMENGQWTNWAIPAQPYTALNADILAQIPQDGIECWTYTDADGNHEIAAENLSWATFTDSCTLTAQYAEQEETGYALTSKVTNPTDGSYYETEATTEADGTIANGPEDPYAEGYVFTGWAVNGDTDKIMTSGAVSATAWEAGTTFVAQFAPVAEEEAASVTFQVTEPGTGAYYEIESPLTEEGMVSQPADPDVDGYVFTGWAVNGDVDNIYTSGAIAATPWTDGTTFVAQFVEEAAPVADTFKVTFDDCIASTENQVVEVESGKTVAKPADPTCEGWTFLGWFTDTALTQEYDFNAPVTSDMTLYAKWQQNEVVTPGTDDPATTPAEPAAPAEENGEQAADEAAAADEQKLPQTADNTMAVAGGVAAVAGVSALAALGAALKRRFQ